MTTFKLKNTLNVQMQAFHLDFLPKASEVKDPVYKHTLTHHLAEYMIDQFPEGSDLYSEFGAVARSSRIDYKELSENLAKMEADCKVRALARLDSFHSYNLNAVWLHQTYSYLLSLSPYLSLTLSYSHSLSLSYTYSLSPSLSFTPSLSLSFSISLSFSVKILSIYSKISSNSDQLGIPDKNSEE